VEKVGVMFFTDGDLDMRLEKEEKKEKDWKHSLVL
jgi:hypothetical protein